MYRARKERREASGKLQQQKSSSAKGHASVSASLPSPPSNSSAMATADPAVAAPETSLSDLPQQMIAIKEQFTAPFIVFDPATRSIAANPLYCRHEILQLHRLQTIFLQVLRPPLQGHLSYTPKELLYELEKALYYAFATAAVLQNSDMLPPPVITDEAAALLLPRLESFLAHHRAPAKAAVAICYCLSEGASRDILQSFLAMLRDRVAQELTPSLDLRRSPAEQRSLRSTQQNVNDIAQLLRDAETAYLAIGTASQHQRLQPQSDASQIDHYSPAANGVSASLASEAYYAVLRWVVAVEADRLALQAMANPTLSSPSFQTTAVHLTSSATAASTSTGAAVTAAGLPETTDASDRAAGAEAAAVPGNAADLRTPVPQLFATVTDYDAFTGRLTLTRASGQYRWGLLLNEKGQLVAIENELRTSSEGGQRLAMVIQQTGAAGGLAVLEVGRQRIRRADLTEAELHEQRDDILRKIQQSLTNPTTTSLCMVVEPRKQIELTVPYEVVYEMLQQGGEGGVGQRCRLLLRRASTAIPWGLRLSFPRHGPVMLTDFADSISLSAAAKTFLFDARGRIHVTKVNEKETAKLPASVVRQTISEALLLNLTLQLTSAEEDRGEAAVAMPEELVVPLPQSDLDATAAAIADNFLTEDAAVAAEEVGSHPAVPLEEDSVEVPAAEIEEGDWIGAVPHESDPALTAEADLPEDGSDPYTIRGSLKADDRLPRDSNDEVENRALLAEHGIAPDSPQGLSEEELPHVVLQLEEEKGAGRTTAALDAAVEAVLREMTASTGAVADPKATPPALMAVDNQGEESQSAAKKIRGRKPAAATADAVGSDAKGKAVAKRGRPKKAAAGASTATVSPLAEANGEWNGSPGASVTTSDEGEGPMTTAAEKPLVDLPSTRAELAMAEAALQKSNQKNRKTETASKKKLKVSEATADPRVDLPSDEAANDVAAGSPTAEETEEVAAVSNDNGEARTDGVDRVSLTELLEAPPVSFSNNIVLDTFDGSTMKLERQTIDQPWNVKVVFSGDDVIMTKLPELPKKSLKHPFIRALGADGQGEVSWLVEGVNGQDLSLMNRSLKVKALGAVKNATKLTFALKALRR